jgi:hypothetical protein
MDGLLRRHGSTAMPVGSSAGAGGLSRASSLARTGPGWVRLFFASAVRYASGMSTRPVPDSLSESDQVAVEPGYEAWKRAKVERALAQSRDRAAMIPADQIWRDLGLER